MVFYLLPLMYLHSIQTYLTKSESKPAANFWSNDSILLSRRPDSVISFAWYSLDNTFTFNGQHYRQINGNSDGDQNGSLICQPFHGKIWKRCSSSCFTFSPDLVALHRWHLSSLDTWGRKIKCFYYLLKQPTSYNQIYQFLLLQRNPFPWCQRTAYQSAN